MEYTEVQTPLVRGLRTDYKQDLLRPVAPQETKLEFLNRRLDFWFNVKAADTEELIKLAQRIRYHTYCKEREWEEDKNCGLEVDNYDARSIHSILTHKISGNPLGTVRLIIQDADNPFSSFPVQELCKDPIMHSDQVLPVGRVAEISRFCLSKELRKQRWYSCNKAELVSDSAREEEERLMIYNTALLIRGVIRLCVENGITHLCSVMEPRLLRLLEKMGIFFNKVGEPVEYHGLRQPGYIRTIDMLNTAKAKNIEMWSVMSMNGLLSEQLEKLEHQIKNPS